MLYDEMYCTWRNTRSTMHRSRVQANVRLVPMAQKPRKLLPRLLHLHSIPQTKVHRKKKSYPTQDRYLHLHDLLLLSRTHPTVAQPCCSSQTKKPGSKPEASCRPCRILQIRGHLCVSKECLSGRAERAGRAVAGEWRIRIPPQKPVSRVQWGLRWCCRGDWGLGMEGKGGISLNGKM